MALHQDPSSEPLETIKTVFAESKIQKLWINFQVYQGAFQERIDILRTQARETPKEDGGDKVMPTLLKKWTGGKTANQPVGNYAEKMSCAFPSDRINKGKAKFSQRSLKSRFTLLRPPLPSCWSSKSRISNRGMWSGSNQLQLLQVFISHALVFCELFA